MPNLQTMQILSSVLSDGLLAGLLIYYVIYLRRPENVTGRGSLLFLLMGFSVASIFYALILMSGPEPLMGFLGLMVRMALGGAIVYSAMLLAKLFAAVRDDARNEFNKKLELEFADRRKIEQDLAHLASFAELDPNVIIEIDPHGDVRYANPAAEKALSDLKSQGRSHPVFEGMEAAIALLRSEGRDTLTRAIRYEDRVYRQQIYLLETGPAVRLHMADVTELTRLEQIQTNLFQRLPAELQSPLSAIQQNLQRLVAVLRPQMNREQEDELLAAIMQLGNLSRLAQELIASSPIDTMHVKIHRQRADLTALVQEVVRFLEPLGQTRGVTFVVHSEPATIEMPIDRDRMLAAFTQVLQNATETAQSGAIEISLKIQGSEAHCQVSARSTLDVKAPEARLSVSRAIMDAHSGRMILQRTSDRYQCMITLPILSADDLFREQVRNLHELAVANGQNLSLIRLQLPSWAALRQKAGEEQAIAVWTYLQRIVAQMLRSESDLAVQTRQSIWLALPGACRADCRAITDRMSQSLVDYGAQNAISEPILLDARIASYPEDAHAVESLLLLVDWFKSEPSASMAPGKPVPSTAKPTHRAA